MSAIFIYEKNSKNNAFIRFAKLFVSEAITSLNRKLIPFFTIVVSSMRGIFQQFHLHRVIKIQYYIQLVHVVTMLIFVIIFFCPISRWYE